MNKLMNIEPNTEEIMTDYQLKTILKMVLDILKHSTDIQDAANKIEKLLKD